MFNISTELNMDDISKISWNFTTWAHRMLRAEFSYLLDRLMVKKKIGTSALRAYPAIVPFRGINVVTGFGKRTNINTNTDLIVDTSARLIVDACDRMCLEKPDINVVLSLLRRRKFRYNGESVTDGDIIHTLECLHVYCELKLNYSELKKEWKSEFDETVLRNEKPNEKLMVIGSSFDLYCRLLSSFGGFNKQFRESHAKSILRECAERKDTISADQFCLAIEKGVRDVTKNGFSVPRPEVVKTLLFESGYRQQLN